MVWKLCGVLFAVLVWGLAGSAAWADDWADCSGDDAEKSLKGCTRIIDSKREKKVDKSIAYSNRALAKERLGRYKEALDDAAKALELNPDNNGAWGARCTINYSLSQYEAAIDACTRVIKADPKADYALRTRADVYSDQSRYQLADDDYTKALEIVGDSAIILSSRGWARSEMMRYEEALVDLDRAIRIDPSYQSAYVNRGIVHEALGQIDAALADYDKAHELQPDGYSMVNRGLAYLVKGDFDKASADLGGAVDEFTKLIEQSPSSVFPIYARGSTRASLAEVRNNDPALFREAVADLERAVEGNPRLAAAHQAIAFAKLRLGDLDGSLAASAKAMALSPRKANHFDTRGETYLRKGELDLAIADLDRAVELSEPYVASSTYKTRGEAQRAKGNLQAALKDFRSALRLDHGRYRAELARLIGETEGAMSGGTAVGGNAASGGKLGLLDQGGGKAAVDLGRRVALVIANSRYNDVPALTNPERDAKAVAGALRRLGFAEVTEAYDLDQRSMLGALQDFIDKAAEADWAVVYYAGHGIELDGSNFLIPVDARLQSDRHVRLETVPLNQVLDAVEAARKFRLVILDACRNNPFLKKMARTNKTRAVTRGLARVEPGRGTLVAYAARDGEEAQDGENTGNSPFVAALLNSIETPQLEIGLLFRRVRDEVLERTNGSQEPFTYGSLPSEGLFFKP